MIALPGLTILRMQKLYSCDTKNTVGAARGAVYTGC